MKKKKPFPTPQKKKPITEVWPQVSLRLLLKGLQYFYGHI